MENIQETKKATAEELLQEMLNHQKRNSRITKIAAFSVIFGVIVLTASLILIIPKTLDFIAHAETSLSEVDKLMAESEAAFSEINEAASEANTMMTQANDVIMPKAVAFIDHAETSLSEVDVLIAETENRMSETEKLIAKADEAMTEIQGTTTKFNLVLDQASVLIDNANTMVENNTEAITETVQKLNKVDFDSLNNAIKNLNDAIEPLARLANMFK